MANSYDVYYKKYRSHQVATVPASVLVGPDKHSFTHSLPLSDFCGGGAWSWSGSYKQSYLILSIQVLLYPGTKAHGENTSSFTIVSFYLLQSPKTDWWCLLFLYFFKIKKQWSHCQRKVLFWTIRYIQEFETFSPFNNRSINHNWVNI